MPLSGCKQQFTFPNPRRRIDLESEAVKRANMFAVNKNLIIGIDLNRQKGIVARRLT